MIIDDRQHDEQHDNDVNVQALLMLGFNPSEQEVVDIPNEIARFNIIIITTSHASEGKSLRASEGNLPIL